MAYLEVVVRADVRPGRLAGFKDQAAEFVRLTQEQDTQTLRCDWFINENGTGCEVHEMFPDDQGLIQHKLHTMEATHRLFRDHAYDHQATLYGEVSETFLHLSSERMGVAPAVFSLLQGLEPAATPGEVLGPLELHAHMKIRPGQLDGFKAQAAELVRLTQEKDTQTVRYDWFIDEDGTDCEVHEAYLSGEGLIEHNTHIVDARAVLFEKYAYDHRMTAFGEVSPEVRGLAKKHAGGIAVYSFLHGLEEARRRTA
jgi:quinol monooxygenase YgiN